MGPTDTKAWGSESGSIGVVDILQVLDTPSRQLSECPAS
ncbi:hypothetical protein D3OALGA1CA_4555 [Olavius algarvensis associated proteobacterium Delta 3]|nr:hypothetical protein D3OALGB2SA_1592 [Olavius algarvensis associated proteobacterium Delta 3]CAB5153263.1 hypothetical protein D3OALGA1CA_4555 [Olavius algarvensis associated proteobacterium Delta 3]